MPGILGQPSQGANPNDVALAVLALLARLVQVRCTSFMTWCCTQWSLCGEPVLLHRASLSLALVLLNPDAPCVYTGVWPWS
jgi:hypothetical protein